jgi:hypothetical protein
MSSPVASSTWKRYEVVLPLSAKDVPSTLIAEGDGQLCDCKTKQRKDLRFSSKPEGVGTVRTNVMAGDSQRRRGNQVGRGRKEGRSFGSWHIWKEGNGLFISTGPGPGSVGHKPIVKKVQKYSDFCCFSPQRGPRSSAHHPFIVLFSGVCPSYDAGCGMPSCSRDGGLCCGRRKASENYYA